MTRRRRPTRLRDTGVAHVTGLLERHGNEIDLGWSLAADAARHAGWKPTSSTPGPASPCDHHDDPDRCTCRDAGGPADVTGEQAIAGYERVHDDLAAASTALEQIMAGFNTLRSVTRRYLPDPTAGAEPICSIPACDSPVERVPGGTGYRGCVLIHGVWAAKPDADPMCARHRKRTERRGTPA